MCMKNRIKIMSTNFKKRCICPPRLGMRCTGCEKPIIRLLDRQVVDNNYWHRWCREEWNAKKIQQLKVELDLTKKELLMIKLFIEQHIRTSSLRIDGTSDYFMYGYVERGKDIWDAIKENIGDKQ